MGVSAVDASRELKGIQKVYSANNYLQIHLGAAVEPLTEEVTGSVQKALWMLLAAVSGVPLIACVNLAGLQLARSVASDNHNALRIAIGAGSRQLLRSSLVESVVLASCGGIAGILAAFWGLDLLLAIAPPGLRA
jgi:putative ABC transport system permease protein